VTAMPKLVVDNPEIRPDLYHGIKVLHLHAVGFLRTGGAFVLSAVRRA
jgi:hypothetical protein